MAHHHHQLRANPTAAFTKLYHRDYTHPTQDPMNTPFIIPHTSPTLHKSINLINTPLARDYPTI